MRKDTQDDLLILISEKAGEQARDNGFSYFEHRMKLGFKNTFYVYTKNNIDYAVIIKYKENILLKDSKQHKNAFKNADYLLLNDGYLDVFPTFKKKPLSNGWAPIVYLQHGIITYKKVHFFKGHYNGRIRYFHTSLSTEKNIVSNILQSKNDIYETRKIIQKYSIAHFKNYVSRSDLESFYAEILSRYYNNKKDIIVDDLQKLKRLIINIGFLDCRVINSGLSRHSELDKKNKSNENLLFFFTWRDEWLNDKENNGFINLVKQIFDSKEILDYATRNNLSIVFYLHEKILHLKDSIQRIFNFDIEFVGQNDFKNVLNDTALCVTDYSSIAFEFNLLKTPVIFVQFDYDKYKFERGHFLKSPCEFLGLIVKSVHELGLTLENKNINSLLKRNATKNIQVVRNDYPNFKKTNSILDSQLKLKQKHIVYFCYNLYGVGGTVQTVINQANYLVSIGYQVSIISLRRTGDIPKLHLDPSVRLEYLNDARKKGRYRKNWENILAQFPSKLFKKTEDLYDGLSLLTDYKLREIIKTIDNSILIGTFPGLCVNLLKYTKPNNVVFVQEHKEFSSHSREIQKSLLKYYHKSKKVIALTTFQKEEYIEQGIKNVINIPNGIQDKFALLQRSKINSMTNRIVSFGRLVPIKGFDLLIKSFALIAKKYPAWNLDIYGDGEEKTNLLKLINDLDISSNVTIHPPTSLVYEEIYNCSFCALTALKEPFGMVYIESFSMAKPVISFDIGYGPKEFLIDGYNSLVAPCFSIEKLSENMEKLIKDEALLKRLGYNARQTYLNNYEISKVMSRFLKECI